jgi:hypothetical protein
MNGVISIVFLVFVFTERLLAGTVFLISFKAGRR